MRNGMKMGRLFATVLLLFSTLKAAGAGYVLPGAPQAAPSENTQVLQKISKGVAAIAKQANQAIVFVSVYKDVKGMPPGMIDPFEFFFGPRGGQRPQDEPPPGGPRGRREGGVGSGFFVDLKRGYILTNNHVVQDADEIQLKLANGQSYEGKIVGRDQNTDVAVVQVKDSNFTRKGLAELPMGNSEDVEVGDFVVALGAPFGLEASLSFGVVSAIGRGNLDITKLGNFIQTDAAINPGNSGGPLLDMAGQVIGVNTAIYSRSGAYNGIGFAVPSNLVRSIAEQLVNNGHIQRGYIGVVLQPIDQELQASLGLPQGVTGGALVGKVQKGSPAAQAGMEPGDVIAEVNGTPMKVHTEVVNTIGLMKPGTRVDVSVYREGKKKVLTINIGQHPEDLNQGRGVAQKTQPGKKLILGMALTNWSEDLAAQYSLESRYGVIITQVEPDGPADRAGLRPGDLILKVDNRKVSQVSEFQKLAEGRAKALIWIERAGQFYFVNLKG
jgi:serine protease Do